MPAIVAFDLDQDIARIKHARRLDALVAAHLDDRFRRDKHFRNLRLQVRITDTRLEAVTNLLLVPRVSMKDKPLLHQKTSCLKSGCSGQPVEQTVKLHNQKRPSLINSEQVDGEKDDGDQRNDRRILHLVECRPRNALHLGTHIAQELRRACQKSRAWAGEPALTPSAATAFAALA